jgi:copper transport protein
MRATGLLFPFAVAVAAAAAALFPASAGAHAYLLSVTPPDRSVVAKAPNEVELLFTESVLPGPGIAAIRNGGGSVLAGKARAQGKTLVIPLRRGLDNGTYTVRWRAISDDGHEVGGVVAFAVGSGQAAPTPALSAGATGPGAGQYLSRWLFFIGLLVASGSAVFQILIWRLGLGDTELSEEERRSVDRRELRAGSLLLFGGFVLAIVGALLLLHLSHASSGTRFGRVLDIGLGISAVGAAAALASLAVQRVRPLVLLAALAVLPIPTLSGHALDAGRTLLDFLVDIAHVTAAAVWLGGLLALAVVLPWAGRVLLPGARERLLLPLARRFSALALAAVVLLAATGVGRALEELDSFSQLWSTGYGRAILVKTALLFVLLGLAVRNRLFLLDGPFRRLRTGVAAESVVLLGLLVAVAVLTALPPGRNAAAATRSREALTTSKPPKPPPPGAVVLAQEDGKLAVALAARPVTGDRIELTATVVSSDNTGVNGLGVSFHLIGTTGATQGPGYSCGSGCYTALSPSVGRPRTARVTLSGKTVSAVRFELPANWPAPQADALVRRATAAYRRLHSVSYVERLSSGPGVNVVSVWKQVAPDRFQYTIPKGPAGIVIGKTRWDKTSPSTSWIRSSLQPIHVPAPIWGKHPTDVRVVGKAGGAWVVSLFDPSLPAWFTIRFDRKTLHPVSLRMTAAAHFMRHEYLSFNQPLRVEPPG